MTDTTIMDTSTVGAVVSAEIDIQIATAKQYPRQIGNLQQRLVDIAAPDSEAAIDSVYSFPRGGKIIEGPSIRFAEALYYLWGNARAGARVINEGHKNVTVQGVFHDLQTNASITMELKKSILDKNGNRYTADMVNVTTNAAAAVVLRNAITKGIPNIYWKRAYLQVRQIALGEAGDLEQNRQACLEHFAKLSINEAQIFELLNIAGVQEINQERLFHLRALFRSLRDGETTIAEVFGDRGGQSQNQNGSQAKPNSGSQGLADRLKNAQEQEKETQAGDDTSQAGNGQDAQEQQAQGEEKDDKEDSLLVKIRQAKTKEDLDYIRSLNDDRDVPADEKQLVKDASDKRMKEIVAAEQAEAEAGRKSQGEKKEEQQGKLI